MSARHGSNLILASLYVEYALVAMALVPHMAFIVDFVARGLGQGLKRHRRPTAVGMDW